MFELNLSLPPFYIHNFLCWLDVFYLLRMYAIIVLQDLDDTGLLTGFQGLVEKPNVAENVVSLLNKLLDNKYSTFERIQVHELLTWNYWPDIIRIFGENL